MTRRGLFSLIASAFGVKACPRLDAKYRKLADLTRKLNSTPEYKFVWTGFKYAKDFPTKTNAAA